MKTIVNVETIIEGEEVSEPFKIERRVRQGCPLASLLFVLSVEALRVNKEKQGVQRVGDGGSPLEGFTIHKRYSWLCGE
jgi:hypothetical protein